MKIDEKQLNEKVLKINNTKVKTSPQLKLKEFDNFLSSPGAKRRNIINDTTISNEPFDFSSSVISSKFEEPPTDQLLKFSLSPSVKKGSGLYKDVIPHTQLVYYDDPNELVVRLNLLTSSQNAGNTGVNNEIISIIEELQGLANELHRPARKVFPRRNTYTKYVWVESLENKTGKECTKGMFNILKQANPKLLQTDNGTEFYNNQFQHTYSVIKCSIGERVIQTLKNNIYKHFTATGTWNWYNRISKIIYNYNHTKHRSIKCTPYEARIKNTSKIKSNIQSNKTSYKPKFKINDKVRISKYKHIFSKGYTPNWTTEIFTVSKVLHTEPITYQLKDGSNNIILGGFYEQEIKLTDFPNTFLIERIIKKVKDKMLVKWMGFDSNGVEKNI
ncbi:hypothetical protein AGLY_002134 [Aphis glycines]|uniref:Integrase catalytic domain-containing protein n=1 Tax=Aphis glycines TaxID=307491 RepID=A0A6G0U3P2_APHGL|nr:hypothetical protein AGLY_002134 [Aphis glycines]